MKKTTYYKANIIFNLTILAIMMVHMVVKGVDNPIFVFTLLVSAIQIVAAIINFNSLVESIKKEAREAKTSDEIDSPSH